MRTLSCGRRREEAADLFALETPRALGEQGVGYRDIEVLHERVVPHRHLYVIEFELTTASQPLFGSLTHAQSDGQGIDEVSGGDTFFFIAQHSLQRSDAPRLTENQKSLATSNIVSRFDSFFTSFLACSVPYCPGDGFESFLWDRLPAIDA